MGIQDKEGLKKRMRVGFLFSKFKKPWVLPVKMKIYIIFFLGLTLFFQIPETPGQSKNQGFIYGKVTTKSGQNYIGHIRWGKEEIFWNDFFNSTKTSTNYIQSLKDQSKNNDQRGWLNLDWEILSIWEDKHNSSYHRLDLRFGDIKSLYIQDGAGVVIMLKNGAKIKGGDNSNDIGTDVKVYDEEIGIINLKWSKIRQVDFLPVPRNSRYIFGSPLYGTVETLRKGNYTGFVQWDHDERISTDILNGETNDGDVDVEFGILKELESKGNGTIMTTREGRRFYVTGTNDVNKENRGIIVTIEDIGKIDIPWREFKKVTFVTPPNSGMDYDSYPSPKALRGRVKILDGNTVEGLIVYDLDESWDFEFLDGKDDELSYFIPFRNVKEIIPKNYNYSIVRLRNGKELLLGNSRDVNEENDGLLIFQRDKEKPVHVKWGTIDQITFE